jgi:hypothetical protein
MYNYVKLQLSKNPMTTEGAKAVVRAITGTPKLNIKYLNIDVCILCHYISITPTKMFYTRIMSQMT